MKTVHFRSSDELLLTTERLFGQLKAKLVGLLPFADVQHIGATAVQGLLTKGDLDINVRVDEPKFDTAASILKPQFDINQPGNWTKTFASFKNDSRYELPVGIQLTIKNGPEDYFVKHRDALRGNRELVKKLNILKRRYEGKEAEEYRKAKGETLKALGLL